MTNPYRLGRKVNHDPRSLSFPAPQAATHRPVRHRIYGAVLDQGNLGSCVGNASAHALNSKGIHRIPSRVMKEADAVDIYTESTKIDPFDGQMPDQDTGTDANSAAKVLRSRGLITGWSHVFGLDHFLGSLQLSGLMLGIDWDDSMFHPDAQGFVHPDGNSAGGHEVFVFGDNPDQEYVDVRNSWGHGWGLRGNFKLSYADLAAKLAAQGDATALHV